MANIQQSEGECFHVIDSSPSAGMPVSLTWNSGSCSAEQKDDLEREVLTCRWLCLEFEPGPEGKTVVPFELHKRNSRSAMPIRELIYAL